ncbi:MAG: hydroxyacid dehydrogenase [Lachnospiraceae bacterium]|nr:hydroxyacid dehydrogenase [Lachnospiraceae bacterium]
MKKVVILESIGIPAEKLEALKAPFAQEAEFISYDKTFDIEALKEETRDADAVILANMPLPAEVIAAAPRLQFIDVAFTGVDHIGLSAAKERGIKVSNASGFSNEAVAELVIAMALSMMRNLSATKARVRAGGTKDGLIGCELMGKTAGIVGYGRIGRRTGELLHAFGCRILQSSSHPHTDDPDYVTQVPLEDLLAESDLVILHTPLNDSTRGLIDYEKLCKMKKTALLINVARGPVTVEDDLARALEEGVIAGAAVDVFTKEPPLPADTQMLAAPNTLLTPHIAFATQESMLRRAEIVFANLRAWFDGGQNNIIL